MFHPRAVYNQKIQFLWVSTHAGDIYQSILCKNSFCCLLFLMINVDFSLFLSLYEDPKGDRPWIFPLWFSAGFQERVWQESSECYFLIFISPE